MHDNPDLSGAGMGIGKIDDFEDLGLDTYAEPERFYSYRRMTRLGEPDYGRHINAIALSG